MEDGISDQHLRRPHSSYTDTSIGIGQKTARGKLFVGALDFRDNFETACDIIFEGLFGIKKCRHCARAHNLLRCNTPRHFDSRRLPLLMLFPSFPYFPSLFIASSNVMLSRRVVVLSNLAGNERTNATSKLLCRFRLLQGPRVSFCTGSIGHVQRSNPQKYLT